VNTGRDTGAAFFWLLFLAAQEKWPATGLPPVSWDLLLAEVV